MNVRLPNPGDRYDRENENQTRRIIENTFLGLTDPATGLGSAETLLDITGSYNAIDDGNLVGDGSTDDRGALNTLVNTTIPSGGGTVVFPYTANGYKIGSSITIPSHVTLRIPHGGKINIPDGVVFEIRGGLEAGPYQVFNFTGSGFGRVIFARSGDVGKGPVARVREILPEWFGAAGDASTDDANALNRAIDAACGDKTHIYGPVSSGGTSGTNTATIAGVGWTASQFLSVTYGYWALVEALDDYGTVIQVRALTANTTDTITVSSNWTTSVAGKYLRFTFAGDIPREADASIRLRAATYYTTRALRVWNVTGLKIKGEGPLATTIQNIGGTTGTVDSATATSITVTGTPYTTDKYARFYWVVMTSGTQLGKQGRITTMTTNSFNWELSSFTGAPSAGDTFTIIPEQLVDFNGASVCQLEGVNLDSGVDPKATYAGLTYQRNANISQRGSTACVFRDVWIDGVHKRAWQIGNGDIGNWQEDLTQFFNVHARGGWYYTSASNFYAGPWYDYGFYFGSGAFTNNLNHTIHGIDEVSYRKGVAIDRTNVQIYGGTIQNNDADIFVIGGFQGTSTVQGIRNEGSNRFLAFDDTPYANAWGLIVENCELQQNALRPNPSGLGLTDWINWSGEGELILRNVRVLNTPGYSSTATGGTTTSVTVSGTPFVADEWAYAWVRFDSGSNSGLYRKITTNTTGALTIEAAPNAVVSGDTFRIVIVPTIYCDGPANILVDGLKVSHGRFQNAFKGNVTGSRFLIRSYEDTDEHGVVLSRWKNVVLYGEGVYQSGPSRFGKTGTEPSGPWIDAIGTDTLAFGYAETPGLTVKALGTSPTPIAQEAAGSETGTVPASPASTTTRIYVGSGITQEVGYHVGDTIKFTSGVNNGVSRTITAHTFAGSDWYVDVSVAFASAPGTGDTFRLGNATYSYYLVAKDRPGSSAKKALVSAAGTVSNVAETLKSNKYINIYPPGPAGGPYTPSTCFDILKSTDGGVTKNLLEADVPVERMYFYRDQGQPTTSYTAPTSDDTGRLTIEGALIEAPTALSYGATVSTDCNNGQDFTLTVTNNTAFTISNPTNATVGQRLTYSILNSSGGAMGAITWGGNFKMAGAFTNPANGTRRTITFYYEATNTWVERNRAMADIA